MRSPKARAGGSAHRLNPRPPRPPRARISSSSPISSTTRTRSNDMYRQHFGLRCAPLDKDSIELWDDGAITHLRDRFQWLLDSPGVGLLTGEPGVGKTATLRHITSKLNPHRYQVIYTAETDFGRVDLYRALARGLGLEPSYRRADLWRDIKQRITELAQSRQIVPVWIIDESQHLAAEFFRDLPSFLNFSQDARDLITVW